LVNLAENEIKKSLNKFDPGMSMVSLSRLAFLIWYSMWPLT